MKIKTVRKKWLGLRGVTIFEFEGTAEDAQKINLQVNI
jgi:hypothetical protein